MQAENARLIREYQAGDDSKIEEIYTKNLPLLISICSKYSMLLDYDFDDTMAIAHISFMKAIAKYRFVNNFSTYLYTAIRNRIIQYVSIERWGREDYSKINFHKNFDSIDDEENYINIKFNENYDKGIILDNLFSAMNILYEREKQILFERYFAERTLKDIGSEYNISRTRVLQIEKNALSKLRKSKTIQEIRDT